MTREEKRIRKCKINDEILFYDMCFKADHDLKDPENYHPNFKYLGIGNIESIEGTINADKTILYYFFKKKTNHTS